MQLAIGYDQEALYDQACMLANQLQLPIDNRAPSRLQLTTERLELQVKGFSPLYADFKRSIWQKRRDAGKQQGLVRACKPKPGLKIIDATAGWGRDAAILASFGAEIILLERNPIMAALLQDALARQDEQSKKNLQLTVVGMDALQYLEQLESAEFPHIIYLDPMHPARHKSALVKKELQILQQLIGSDEDALALLTLARTKVKDKVVVKWPQSLAPLLPPTSCVSGKTVRFDLYQAS